MVFSVKRFALYHLFLYLLGLVPNQDHISRTNLTLEYNRLLVDSSLDHAFRHQLVVEVEAPGRTSRQLADIPGSF
jgi:hypothetical protein